MLMNKPDVHRYSYIEGNKIIETSKGKFLITPKCNDKLSIFRYLEQKDFPFFLPMENSYRDSYEVYSYVEDNVDINDKAIDFVHILSLLHIKTTTYREVVMDSVKKLYEDTLKKIDEEMQYYQKLQDEFEEHVYMAPDEYFFIRNVSLLYENLRQSREYLEHWYQIKKKENKERIVFLHRQPSLSNFVDQKTPYFIHWDLSNRGYIVYDFLYFYKENFTKVEMQSLFHIYQRKCPFTEDEMYLFFCLLLLDEKIIFTSNHYDNTVFLYHRIHYAFKVKEFLLEQNQKEQEADKQEFN